MTVRRSLFVAAVSVFFLITGCTNNPTSQNAQEDYSLVAAAESQSGEEIAKDIAAMADVFNYTKTGILSKQSAGDIQWQTWTYGNSWWVRSGSVSISSDEGSIDIQGIDSVKFIDATSSAVREPLLADIRGGEIRHHASAYLEKNGGGFIDASRDWNLSGSISSEELTLTLNGSYSQKFKAENSDKSLFCNVSGSATVSNVVFEKNLIGWSKPVSGSVTVTSPYTTVVVEFLNGSAHIQVTAKDGDVIKDITINL